MNVGGGLVCWHVFVEGMGCVYVCARVNVCVCLSVSHLVSPSLFLYKCVRTCVRTATCAGLYMWECRSVYTCVYVCTFVCGGLCVCAFLRGREKGLSWSMGGCIVGRVCKWVGFVLRLGVVV